MFISVILYTALCLKLNASIPPQYIALIAILVELFYATPLCVINYFKLYERPLGNKTFIAFLPHLNYISCMSGLMQVICTVLLVVSLLLIGLLFSSGWIALMPDDFILNYQDYMTTILVASVTIYNIFIGIGLYQVTIDVRKIYNKNLPSVEAKGIYKTIDTISSYLPFAEFPILALPLLRSISMFGTIAKMEDLNRLQYSAFTEVNDAY